MLSDTVIRVANLVVADSYWVKKSHVMGKMEVNMAVS